MSVYKTRNPIFAFLLSIIETFLSKKTAIVRKKHVSIMDTREVRQNRSKLLHLYFLCKTVCSFGISV